MGASQESPRPAPLLVLGHRDRLRAYLQRPAFWCGLCESFPKEEGMDRHPNGTSLESEGAGLAGAGMARLGHWRR